MVDVNRCGSTSSLSNKFFREEGKGGKIWEAVFDIVLDSSILTTVKPSTLPDPISSPHFLHNLIVLKRMYDC